MTLDVSGGATPLAHWGVIRAEGDEAAAFLNGQLTNEMQSLSREQARLAGYCSAKGRLLASFVVWRPADHVFLLACSADVLASTLKRLSMYVLRARCKLSDVSAAMPLFGAVGEAAGVDAPTWTHRADGDASLVRLPDASGVARALWCGPAAQAPTASPAMPVDVWDRLEVASGVARIVAATVEQFVPQMLNYELIGGVDFRKGCYPGQEIVARSQYRGTVKRRTFRFDVPAPAQPGDEIFAADDPSQPAGIVVNAAADERGGSVLLVELKLASAQAALHLHTADGPLLHAAALPYALPAAEPAA
jgi:folate-binding protein YgfZ